mmetsp:Transcript_31586/g.73639  ORF Transcript_31586/g.73639 Transcript_31586/m.73639 type:complete len:342 (+) Transcript_31586:84-1109(+)
MASSDYYSDSSGLADEEDIEDSFSRYGYLVNPAYISSADRYRVRKAVVSQDWTFERRGGYVRPPRKWRGSHFPLADLGECGDRNCGNYRLGDKTREVRPSFLEFCVAHIRRAFSQEVLSDGIVLCTLGSGRLLFDWELCERLVESEGVRFKALQLVDKAYGPDGSESANRAQQIFAGWFRGTSTAQCKFRSFLSVQDLQSWIASSGEAAHILLDCDAVGVRKKIDVEAFRTAVLQPGGLCLVLSNPAKRSAILKTSSGKLELLEQHYFDKHDGTWTPRRPPSTSSDRDRKKRRSRSKRRDREGDRDQRRLRSEKRACQCERCRQTSGIIRLVSKDGRRAAG